MSTIDSSIRTVAYQPGAGDEAALASSGKKPAKNDISLETAALSQAAATHTLSSLKAFQAVGMQLTNIHGATPAAQAQLGAELSAVESNQPVDIYAIMGLIQKSAQEMRNANREIRASELKAQVGELLSAASDMHKAANFRLAAGIVQGCVQMTSGAVQAYGSVRAAAKSAQAIKPQAEAAKLKNEGLKMTDDAHKLSTQAQDLRAQAGVAKSSRSVTKLQAQAQEADTQASNLRSNARAKDRLASAQQAQVDGLSESARSFSTNSDAAGKVLGGAGDIITAGLRFGADSADVSAKRHEARAKLHESAFAGANEMMQQMMDVIRDVRDKLSSIDQSRIETNRGIARNI